MDGFQSRYIFPNELQAYGLSSSSDPCVNTGIQNLVDTASTLIDEYCGRTDGDGNGSLVYTTYVERVLAQSAGRNFFVLPQRPAVAITQDTVTALQALDAQYSGYYYTGALPYVNTLYTGAASPIIAASGRYIPGRRDNYGYADEPNSWLNPLNVITLFGGPPPWNPIDMVNLDLDCKLGYLWLSAGLQLARYSEVVVTYTSGFDPRNMPKPIKRACAMMVKNYIAKFGTTGMISFNSSKVGANAEYAQLLIDPNIETMLNAFKTFRTA